MAFIHRFLLPTLTVVLLAATQGSWAASSQASKGKRAQRSSANPTAPSAVTNAEVFYEVLLGEMATRAGDPGAGFSLMLEAARRSNDEKLYQRAADMALQVRSGDSALSAAQAWKAAWPRSREANRYVLQILIALNRVAETAGPLTQELAHSPPHTYSAALLALPALYHRVTDKALAASIVEQALAKYLTDASASAPSWVAVGRMRLLAEDKKGALDAAKRAQEAAPVHEGAALLALELLERGEMGAAPIAQKYFEAQPTAEQRLAYARVLVQLQRYGQAERQLQRATQENPQLADGWLLYAAVLLQNDQTTTAEAALQSFMALSQSSNSNGGATSAANPATLSQAYLLYAQLAEKRQDYTGAETWLNRIDNPPDIFNAQVQRAYLLARQGKLTQARDLIAAQPAPTAREERLKWLAEVQLLRDVHAYREAYELQTRIVAESPDDNEAIYEQAMLAEKAGLLEVMEQLLRGLIARQPDFHHAYNALGYTLAERGVRLEEAKALIETALRYAPDDPFITDSLGWVEFRLGNHAEALRLLERAFRTRPDAEIAAHLGEVLWVSGQPERAKVIWRESLRLKPNNPGTQEVLRRLGVEL